MTFYLLDNAQPNTQQWGYPRRGAQLSGTCIIHTAECAADTVGPDGSAENTAEFIRTRSDYGSYHTLVDSDSIIELVPYEYEAWQDSETNPWAVGISAAVQADHWDAIPAERRNRIYRNMAAAAADFVTYMATKGITVPLRRITGEQARARVPGFCAHGDSGVSRHDPGVQFEWATFFAYTKQTLAGGAAIGTQGTITPIEEDTLTVAEKNEIIAAVQAEGEKTRAYIGQLLVSGYTVGDKKYPGGNLVGITTQTRASAALALVTEMAKNPNLTAEKAQEIIETAMKATIKVDVNVAGGK